MNSEDKDFKKPICRLVNEYDGPQVIDLMQKANFTIAALNCRSIYDAIYRQALKDRKVVFGVAEYEKKLIGLVIAIIDWNKFWLSFFLGHPMLSLHILVRQLLKICGVGVAKRDYEPEQLKTVEKFLTTAISNRSWKDSSPQIAKAMFISVDPEYRGLKVGLDLNRFRDKVFIERGVKRYDGWVELHRIPQINLLHKTGFLIERRGDKFFVSKDL